MSTYSDLAAAVSRVADAAVEAGRLAHAVDVHECDELLDALLAADRKMRTATAYLRRRARPRSIGGLGESNDRMRQSMDELQITFDRIRARDVEDEYATDDEVANAPTCSDWQAFVDGHPELTAPLAFTDEQLVGAVSDVVAQWSSYYAERRLRPNRTVGASASCVAQALAGFTPIPSPKSRNLPAELKPSRGDVIRVGQRLGRLAREGRVRAVSRSYESRKYAPITHSDDA